MAVRAGLQVHADAAGVAQAGARILADALSAAVAARGRAALAVSGGRTPAAMFGHLAATPLPWHLIDVFQVDERLAPDGHRDRNATALTRAFAAGMPGGSARFHWMPVTTAEPVAAASEYASTLLSAAGSPPVLDVVHLGLGADGHTASVFPGEGLAQGVDVAVTGPHHGRRRMTLTLAAINRARLIVWIVAGRDKRDALAGLLHGDPAWVAGRVRRTDAIVLADADAAPHA